MAEITRWRFKLRTMWVSTSLLLFIVSLQSACLFTLAYPKHQFSFTFLTAMSLVVAALSIMQALEGKWWFRLLVLVTSYLFLSQMIDFCSRWAEVLRWPNGMPENDSALNTYASSQALAGAMALLASAIVVLVWLGTTIWLAKRKTNERV